MIQFFGGFAVVAADAHDLRRFRRRQQANGVQLQVALFRSVEVENDCGALVSVRVIAWLPPTFSMSP